MMAWVESPSHLWSNVRVAKLIGWACSGSADRSVWTAEPKRNTEGMALLKAQLTKARLETRQLKEQMKQLMDMMLIQQQHKFHLISNFSISFVCAEFKKL